MSRRTRRLFDIFNDMQREFEQTFEELLSGHSMWDSSTGRLEPLIQVSETLDKIIVTIDLPLVHKEDIHLTVEEDHLKIEAQLDRCVKYEHWGVQRDCEFNSFYKIVPLPVRVNPEETKAKFKKGVLSIELPKTFKGRKISVE